MSVLQSESASDIIARAFGWAEHKARFDSLEDGTIDARQARIAYDARRRNVLESMDWNFARRRYAPGQVLLNTPSPKNMPHAFSVPPACLRVRNVTAGYENTTWRREAVIFSSASDDVQVVYTSDETNPGIFAPSFTLALEYLLAAQFAMVHARSVNRSDRMLKNYRDAMREADQMEGVEQSNDDAYERGALDLALGSYDFARPIS
ncbi:hypothetical protein [Roseobacter sp.]|uniref:hypothetical protein n=1 Tax=Roseobacter sp. TaxID=1907202 RepID=UPI0029676157|nr:hypothetical protein [Roseobacter sp.]MDW3181773.1 hypothetical protein [Roseobacter sp.]